MSPKVGPLVTAWSSIHLPAQLVTLTRLSQSWLVSSPFETTARVPQCLRVIMCSWSTCLCDGRGRHRGSAGRGVALPSAVQRPERGEPPPQVSPLDTNGGGLESHTRSLK